MTLLADPAPVDPSGVEPVTAAELIGQVREACRRREQADRDVLRLGLVWATAHEVPGPVLGGADFPDSLPVDDRVEVSHPVDIEVDETRFQWRGLPVLAWDAAAPFAAALGLSTRGGSTVLRHALTLAHRLPRTQARWETGVTDTRTARKVADAVAGQPDDVCAWIDHQVGKRLDKHRSIGPIVLDRLLGEALTELHAEELELEREEALQARYARYAGDPNGPRGAAGPDALGLVENLIRGDWPDITAFDDTITALAEAIRRSDRPDAGEPLQVRRSIAVGIIADPQTALALLNGDTSPASTGSARIRKQKILLTCHLAADAVTGIRSSVVSRDVDGKPWLTSQVQAWAGREDVAVSVRPVLHCGGCADCDQVCAAHADPDAHHHYRPTDLQQELVALRQPRCVFPHCVTPARRTDCDHIIAFDPDHPEGTPTCPRCNLAPLCRHHHRLKTHAGWRYRQLEPGTYDWTEPHGQHFLTTRWGTTDITGPVDEESSRAGPLPADQNWDPDSG